MLMDARKVAPGVSRPFARCDEPMLGGINVMNVMTKTCVASLGFAVVMPVLAADTLLTSRYVDEIGAHTNAGQGFVSFVGGHPDCKYGVIYIDLDNNGGRAGYAALLTAKRSGAAVYRIAYAIQPD